MADLHPEGQVLRGLRPIAATALAFGLGLSSLSRQSKRPRITLLTISIPTLTAFLFDNDFSPDDYLNEIFARTLLIWLAHMSFLLVWLPLRQFSLTERDLQSIERKRYGKFRKRKSLVGKGQNISKVKISTS